MKISFNSTVPVNPSIKNNKPSEQNKNIQPAFHGSIAKALEQIAKPEQINYLRRILSNEPKNIEAAHELGRRLVNELNILLCKIDKEHLIANPSCLANEAIDCLSVVIDAKPDCWEDLFKRGFVYVQQKQWTKALEDFTRCIEIKPNDETSYLFRGNTLVRLQRHEEALKDLDRSIELNPKSVQAYSDRGVLNKFLKKFEAALDDFTKAMDLEPTNLNLFNQRAKTYIKLNRLPEALNDFLIYLNAPEFKIKTQNKRDFLGAAEKTIEIGTRLGKYDETLKWIEALEKNTEIFSYGSLNHEKASIYFYKGIDLANQGKNFDAISLFTQSLNLTKDKNQKGPILFLRGLSEKVVGDIWNALDDLKAASTILRDEGNAKNYEEAVKTMRELAEKIKEIVAKRPVE